MRSEGRGSGRGQRGRWLVEAVLQHLLLLACCCYVCSSHAPARTVSLHTMRVYGHRSAWVLVDLSFVPRRVLACVDLGARVLLTAPCFASLPPQVHSAWADARRRSGGAAAADAQQLPAAAQHPPTLEPDRAGVRSARSAALARAISTRAYTHHTSSARSPGSRPHPLHGCVLLHQCQSASCTHVNAHARGWPLQRCGGGCSRVAGQPPGF
jgi:hypothetical protein